MAIDRRRFLTGAAGTAAIAAGTAAIPAWSASASAVAEGGAPTVGASTGPATGQRVRTGVEALIASGYAAVRGQKVGIVANPSSILPDLRHVVDVMHDDDRVDLIAVFEAEHGFRGIAQAGGSEGFFYDPHTGLPVYDSYLKSGQALADLITQSGVDTVMFNIQDIGARFITNIWTLYDTMVAAAMAGKRYVVLDRPNATSGRRALGPVMHTGYETFVGRKPISQMHGMTVGELAQMYNSEWVAGDAGRTVELTVIEMEGWFRDMYYEQTGLPWVPTSPNIPTVDSAVVYPGTCMFEGTNLSEGRGTTRPFEEIAAPYGDWHWRDALTALDLPGAAFRENYFSPTFSKYTHQALGGVELYVTDRDTYDPIRTGIAMLVTAKQVYPNGFSWHSGVNPDTWIDNLTGSDYVRTSIDAGKNTDTIVAGWQDELAAFRQLREKYLIYRHERGGH